MTSFLVTICISILLGVLGNPGSAQAGDVPCEFRGKAHVRGYLTCLEKHEPRYRSKGKGYTNLGNRYEFGDTVARDARQAAMYYELACEHANGDGCAYLARLYRRGHGVKKNRKKAAKLLRRAYLFE